MSPSPKYIVLGWDYNDNTWKVAWYGTSKAAGRKAMKTCIYSEVRLIKVLVIATEDY